MLFQSQDLRNVSSYTGTGGEFPPDSKGRSPAREIACFAARRANGATKRPMGTTCTNVLRETHRSWQYPVQVAARDHTQRRGV